MKKLLCLIPALLCFVLMQAQFKTIAEGQIFDEPEKGFCKILQMKNGNTFFFRFTFKDGIYVQPYNSKHKEGAEVHIEPQYGKLAKSDNAGTAIEGIFEVSGDVLIFVSKFEGRAPTLFRMILDGNTGKLKEDKIICTLDKVSFGQGYSIAVGGVPLPGFYVKKDPFSDNYGIVLMHSFEEDRNKRLEILHYGANNELISQAFFKSPNDYYKYLQYVDMTVMGKERVCVIAYAYNTRSSGGKASELLMANLKAGDKVIAATKLDFTKDLTAVNGNMKYNPVTKKLILVIAGKENEKDSYFTSYIAYVNPDEKKLEYSATAAPAAATAKSAEIFGEKKAFYGLPQNIYINKDGSFVIVYEEIILEAVSRSSGSGFSMGGPSSYNTRLGNIAIGSYSITGAELGSYLIVKSQYLPGARLYPYYLSDREGQAQKMDDGNQFKSFSYIDGQTKPYILFNDVAENEERVAKGKKPTTIQGVGECDAYLYSVTGRDIMPTRQYAFGEPAKKEHNLALFSISDYDKNSNSYVTLKLAKEGRQKGVQLVWLQPI